jgi:uncharacterized membrane protein
MMLRIRRIFVTGFFVTVPLVVSVVAVVWMFRWADSFTSGLGQILVRQVPGLDVVFHLPGLGLLATAVIIFLTGLVATNVFGRRVLQRGEQVLLHVPLFRTIYAPIKQLIAAFSPENEVGFKRMVLADDGSGRLVLGFLMKDFVVDRGQGPEEMLAVYVPTNHLYIGDIIICAPERVSYPELSVEEGLRVFLTGGMGLPDRMRLTHAAAAAARASDSSRSL